MVLEYLAFTAHGNGISEYPEGLKWFGFFRFGLVWLESVRIGLFRLGEVRIGLVRLVLFQFV